MCAVCGVTACDSQNALAVASLLAVTHGTLSLSLFVQSMSKIPKMPSLRSYYLLEFQGASRLLPRVWPTLTPTTGPAPCVALPIVTSCLHGVT